MFEAYSHSNHEGPIAASCIEKEVRFESFSLWANHFRGRDASYLAPPAQIRTGPIRAYGSHLGCLTAKRLSGRG